MPVSTLSQTRDRFGAGAALEQLELLEAVHHSSKSLLRRRGELRRR